MMVKICGIRHLEAAQAAVEASADFIGFNFVPTSSRYIRPDGAKNIIDQLAINSKALGIFQDASLEEVNNTTHLLGLEYVQLHGRESNEYCSRVGAKVIKAFSLPAKFTVDDVLAKMKGYNVDSFMIDRQVQGEGAMLDLEGASNLAKQAPLFYAGGLTPENVSDVVAKVRPIGVDVAGGIETDGKEDITKIREFIKRAKEV